MREETPQPTMRVTDGSSALSMIYREETTANIPLRTDTHTHTHTYACAGSSGGRALSGTADSSL